MTAWLKFLAAWFAVACVTGPLVGRYIKAGDR